MCKLISLCVQNSKVGWKTSTKGISPDPACPRPSAAPPCTDRRGHNAHVSHTHLFRKTEIGKKVLLPSNTSLTTKLITAAWIHTTLPLQMLISGPKPSVSVTTGITHLPHPPPSYAPPGILQRGWCWRWCCRCCAAESWSSPLSSPQSGSAWLMASVPASAEANVHGHACDLHGNARDHPEGTYDRARGAWF